MSRPERRVLVKELLARYLEEGYTYTEAKSSIMHDARFAADPPSSRAIDEWHAQLKASPSGDLVDDEVRARRAHPLEDHRRAVLAQLSGHVTRHNEQIARLESLEVEATEDGDVKLASKYRKEIRDESKRYEVAIARYMAATGIDKVPLEAQLDEPEHRARICAAIWEHPREFSTAQLRQFQEWATAELVRRERAFDEHVLPAELARLNAEHLAETATRTRDLEDLGIPS